MPAAGVIAPPAPVKLAKVENAAGNGALQVATVKAGGQVTVGVTQVPGTEVTVADGLTEAGVASQLQRVSTVMAVV